MSRRWRWPVARRGVVFQVPLEGAAPPPPSVAPPQVARTATRPAVAVRRGAFLQVPPAPVVVASPTLAPRFARQAGTVKPGGARHGRFLYTPSVPSGPVPRRVTLRRPPVPPVRRGRLWAPPTAPQQPVAGRVPDRLARRRAALAVVPRGNGWTVLAGGAVIVEVPDVNPDTLTVTELAATVTVTERATVTAYEIP